MTTETQADACPFCGRIAKGQFGESARHAVSFEPLNPVTPGHLLVVPREHVADAAEAPGITAITTQFAAELAGRLGEDFNIITSAGAAATQTVRHLHLHLVPRREGDGLHLPWTGQRKPTAVEPGSWLDGFPGPESAYPHKGAP